MAKDWSPTNRTTAPATGDHGACGDCAEAVLPYNRRHRSAANVASYQKGALHVLAQRLGVKLASRGISRCLTASRGPQEAPETGISRSKNHVLSAFLHRLGRDSTKDRSREPPAARRRNANAGQKRRLVENLFFNWMVTGTQIRRSLRTSTTGSRSSSSSAPRCAAISAARLLLALYSKDGELSEAELDRISPSARIGIHWS